MSKPSVTTALSVALNRTGRILFKPFEFPKWFIIGFCAWLAHLGESGGFPSGQGWGGGGGGPGGPGGQGVPTGQDAIDWINQNLAMILTVGLAILVVVLLITAVLTWLRCRGKFMFLDCIVRNRAAVAEPWRTCAELGNSLFGFMLAMIVIAWIAMLGTLAVAAAIAWPDIQAAQFGQSALAAAIFAATMLLIETLALVIISVLLEDFVIPTMYRRGERVTVAWRTAKRELLAPAVGPVVLFYLMRIVIAFVIGAIATTATCLTCCLTAVPYLGTVILLPLFVFRRCYSVAFIEQYGPQWAFFQDGDRCLACGYDLRATPEDASCPECGAPRSNE